MAGLQDERRAEQLATGNGICSRTCLSGVSALFVGKKKDCMLESYVWPSGARTFILIGVVCLVFKTF